MSRIENGGNIIRSINSRIDSSSGGGGGGGGSGGSGGVAVSFILMSLATGRQAMTHEGLEFTEGGVEKTLSVVEVTAGRGGKPGKFAT